MIDYIVIGYAFLFLLWSLQWSVRRAVRLALSPASNRRAVSGAELQGPAAVEPVSIPGNSNSAAVVAGGNAVSDCCGRKPGVSIFILLNAEPLIRQLRRARWMIANLNCYPGRLLELNPNLFSVRRELRPAL